ncbi:MAG: hypothetical protein WCW52_09375 [Elusimicrobiales bacterium]|jgi:hypothetical protein
MGIDFNINIKRKITVNGKEYGSPEEVPEQYRQIVQGALSSAESLAKHSKITFNGAGYDSPEAMPPDTRIKYEEALRKAKVAAQNTGSAAPPPVTPAPEGALSKQTIIILLLLTGIALLLKFFKPG